MRMVDCGIGEKTGTARREPLPTGFWPRQRLVHGTAWRGGGIGKWSWALARVSGPLIRDNESDYGLGSLRRINRTKPWALGLFNV
jgi:hypothetical protein